MIGIAKVQYTEMDVCTVKAIMTLHGIGDGDTTYGC